MERLTVGLGTRSYPIFVGENILGRLSEFLVEVGFPQKVAVVTNPTVRNLYGIPVIQSLNDGGFCPTEIIVPDGEQYKNLHTLEKIYDELIAARFDRTCGMVALGGGVIGDITGFAAATFLRGIPFVQIPTTLLAQVDSSVGGKTAVNHRLGKNLIGAFYQPRLVCIDISLLKTLPLREFSAGWAEVVKYGIIRDKEFFNWLSRNAQKLLAHNGQELAFAVKKSCQIKANIVEIDETESSMRAILNFGHTFGHAIETLSGYGNYLHGEAIAIGMAVASKISTRLGMASQEDGRAIQDLLDAFHLPVSPPDFPPETFVEAMMRDKKVQDGTLRLVLNLGIGDCRIEKVSDPLELFTNALG